MKTKQVFSLFCLLMLVLMSNCVFATSGDAILMHPDDPNNERTDVLGTNEYLRTDIKTITLLDTNDVPDDAFDSWDISKNKD